MGGEGMDEMRSVMGQWQWGRASITLFPLSLYVSEMFNNKK